MNTQSPIDHGLFHLILTNYNEKGRRLISLMLDEVCVTEKINKCIEIYDFISSTLEHVMTHYPCKIHIFINSALNMYCKAELFHHENATGVYKHVNKKLKTKFAKECVKMMNAMLEVIHVVPIKHVIPKLREHYVRILQKELDEEMPHPNVTVRAHRKPISTPEYIDDSDESVFVDCDRESDEDYIPESDESDTESDESYVQEIDETESDDEYYHNIANIDRCRRR